MQTLTQLGPVLIFIDGHLLKGSFIGEGNNGHLTQSGHATFRADEECLESFDSFVEYIKYQAPSTIHVLRGSERIAEVQSMLVNAAEPNIEIKVRSVSLKP